MNRSLISIIAHRGETAMEEAAYNAMGGASQEQVLALTLAAKRKIAFELTA